MKQRYFDAKEVEFHTIMKVLDMDEERRLSILKKQGHIISRPKGGIKKELRNEFGIFSPLFGQTLEDVNPFQNRYRCECKDKEPKGRFYNNMICEDCGQPVRFVDDDFDYFGWIVLNNPSYHIIHPNLYKNIEYIIGESKLQNILYPHDEKDIDGHSVEFERPKDEPFYGTGMIDFKDRFDEIMKYYIKKSPAKRDHYTRLIKEKKKIFISSIPVYTTQLRPYKVDGDNFRFGDTNEKYMMMVNIADKINKTQLKINRKKKTKNQLLYDLQMKYNELYVEIEKILSGKKGNVRMLFGGRYNFTARNVIVPDPTLGVNEVSLSYATLTELLQQSIINILQKTYNMSYDQAYKMWDSGARAKNPRIWEIIQNIINEGIWVENNDGKMVHHKGVPVLINRNPTINYGGIMQMFCTRITDTYTMGVPLQILSTLAADFDGDVLNILYIINKRFLNQCYQIYNPRNAMFISRNDGMFNNDFNHSRDTMVNLNTFVYMTRNNYDSKQLDKIRRIKTGDWSPSEVSYHEV